MEANKQRYDFNDFVEIIKKLRSEDGCPWDKAQTHESLRKNLIEESYEFIQEVDSKSKEGMCEELGDVLLQVLLHSQIANDDGEFTIDDVVDGIAKKMVFRHPHVFGDQKADNVEDAFKFFTQSKNKEKKLKSKSEEISHVPEELPALIKSYKMYNKLEKMQPNYFTGKFEDYIKKVKEELDELELAYRNKDIGNFEEELGDVLTTVVALGHTMNVDSEIALNKSFKKVVNRIKIIEEKCLKQDEKLDEISPETFIQYWKNAKSMGN